MVIKELSDTNLILDFEGSDIPGIADFYNSMGPIAEHYSYVKFNNLPRIIKLIKR